MAIRPSPSAAPTRLRQLKIRPPQPNTEGRGPPEPDAVVVPPSHHTLQSNQGKSAYPHSSPTRTDPFWPPTRHHRQQSIDPA